MSWARVDAATVAAGDVIRYHDREGVSWVRTVHNVETWPKLFNLLGLQWLEPDGAVGEYVTRPGQMIEVQS